MSHLCTSESLLAGAIECESRCLICREKTPHRVGYIFQRCEGCGSVYDEHCGRTVRLRRERLGLSKQEMADLYGVKKQTITQYENWPCRKYWHWILQLTQTGETDE